MTGSHRPDGGPVQPDRRLCVLVMVVPLVVLVALAGWLVPWHWVPVCHLVPVSARVVFSPAQIALGSRFSGAQRHLGWAALALSLLLALVLGLTRLGRWLLGRLPGPWWLRVPVGTLVLVVLGRLLTLPLALRARRLDLDYGLTRQSLGGWARDQGLSLLVAFVTTALGMVVLVALARRLPRTWPLWGGLLAAGLVVAGSFAYPVVVEPLFNHFTSLPQGPLRSEILVLARTEHVRVSDVLVADASRRTTTLNAYVSGLGGTRRVVLYDTLLGQPRREVESVVAHELGHAREHDVALGTALGALGAMTGVGLLGLLLGERRLLRRARVSSAGDPVAVALVVALVSVGSLATSPVQNTVSRAIEARADRSALHATHDTAAFVALQRELALRALVDPTPPAWSQTWFGTHPTSLQRIGIARALAEDGSR